MEFTIIKDGKKVGVNDALSMLEVKPYDPQGLHTSESEHYVLNCLHILKESDLVDSYNFKGELPKVESKKGAIY